MGSTDGLVGVGGLLGGDTVAVVALLVAVGGATRAAASAKHPEEGTAQREDNREPGGSVNVFAHGDFNTIGLHCGSERALCNGEQDCRGEGSGEGEEERHNGDDGSDTAAPATADGEDSNQDLGAGGDECDEVGDEHPLRNGLVDLHDLLHAAAKFLLKLGFTHSQDRRRVEVVLSLGIRARGDGRLAIGNVALAVTPKTDVVKVGDSGIILESVDEF